jgi:hypothetical protein
MASIWTIFYFLCRWALFYFLAGSPRSPLSIKSTVTPLTDEFMSYLEADGILVLIGSENLRVHRH